MIYITGDTHMEYSRFNTRFFPDQKKMTKDDYMIICGDFGIWEASREQEYWLDWLNDKSYTTLFIDGNHENYDLLYGYPVKTWHGGKTHEIRPSVLHLMRGQIFNIEEKLFFTMGGASSHDIGDGILDPAETDFQRRKRWLDKQGRRQYRILRQNWWAEELPCAEEYAQAKENLNRYHNQVDCILTHQSPSGLLRYLSDGSYTADPLSDFLEEIRQGTEFKQWFFGHYHKEMILEEKYRVLYESIVRLE